MDNTTIGGLIAALIAAAGAGHTIINRFRKDNASTSSEVGHMSRMDREAERHEKRISILERRVRLLERRDAMLVALCVKHDIDVMEVLRQHGLHEVDDGVIDDKT